MGGLRKYMPITFATMITGWLAISGIPIFAGFFSKDEILWKVWSAPTFSLPSTTASKILWFVGAVTALLTAVYMTRMMVMTFWGPERFREAAGGEADDAHATEIDEKRNDSHASAAGDRALHAAGEHVHGGREPHESPWTMTVPLIVLAVLSTLGGLIGVPYALSSFFREGDANYLERTLEPVVAELPSTNAKGERDEETAGASRQGANETSVPHSVAREVEHPLTHAAGEVQSERLLAFVSVLIALAGIAIGWTVFQKRPLLQMPKLLENKYYVDEVYDTAIIHPIEDVSRRGLWQIFDIKVLDGLLHSIGETVTDAGALARHLQAGFVRGYAAIILVGALVLIGFFAYLSISH